MRPYLTLGLCAALALPGCGSSDADSLFEGQPVGLLEYTAIAPVEWVPAPTSSSMRLAEFTVGGDPGGADAEVVAYYFGPGQGGTVEANAQRWTAQFFDSEGGHPVPDTEVVEGGLFPTTLVTLEGAYARTVGMGGTPADAVPDQMLLAAVVETPRGNLYLQMHGPSSLVRSQRRAFLGFVRTIRPHPAGGTPG